jgi:hypothetical protein
MEWRWRYVPFEVRWNVGVGCGTDNGFDRGKNTKGGRGGGGRGRRRRFGRRLSIEGRHHFHQPSREREKREREREWGGREKGREFIS